LLGHGASFSKSFTTNFPPLTMFYRKIFEMHIKISSAYKTILVIEGRKHDAAWYARRVRFDEGT
jgi:hypothetical protein